ALDERLADALDDPAMHLSAEQQRIDHLAEIIDHRVAQDSAGASLGIELKLADMAAIGECRDLGRELGRARERLRRLARDAEDVDEPVGAGDDVSAVAKLDIGGGRLEEIGGELLALLDH